MNDSQVQYVSDCQEMLKRSCLGSSDRRTWLRMKPVEFDTNAFEDLA